MRKIATAVLTLLLAASVSCSSTNHHQQAEKPAAQPIANNLTAQPAVENPENTQQEVFTPLSPYSSDGLMALNEFRSNNIALNDFLIRNRKPDYFFSGINSSFAYQKIYLVYLESENLYLFDPQLTEPYKKFHPLPDAIKESLKTVLAQEAANKVSNDSSGLQQTPQTGSSTLDYQVNIEKSLTLNKLEPYLNARMLYAIPTDGDNTPIYPDLYFLDKPLDDLLENEYSIKYDAKKQTLKLIFPKSYEAAALYKKSSIETRKIFVERTMPNSNTGTGSELSLVVPDFLPGSSFYQTTHGNMTKVFSSLYQVKVPQNYAESHRLHMRYSIKLCQKDNVHYCATTSNHSTSVRAIVIAATLYDSATNIPIETFVLK